MFFLGICPLFWYTIIKENPIKKGVAYENGEMPQVRWA